MFKATVDWNPMQTKLKELIKHRETFLDAINLCFELHSFVHLSPISNKYTETLADYVYKDLDEFDYSCMPTARDVTIAWNIWHITRIEDITMNILVGDGTSVLNDTWLSKLNTKVTDTGNAMTDDEIISLSKELNKTELCNYRNEVGAKSRNILKSLVFDDLKRKFTTERVEQIMEEKCLTSHPDSIWLKDFWGKKNVSGILILPLTKHQNTHLNNCLNLKKKCSKFKSKT